MFIFTTIIIYIAIGRNSAALDSLKICAEESTNEKSPVVWPSSLGKGQKINSVPLCINESQELITRICNQSGWFPKHGDVPDCFSTQSRPALEQCPPGYSPMLKGNGKIKFCYQLTEASSWDFPCFNSGSTMTLFDLDSEDLENVISRLNFDDKKLVWIPAHRATAFEPVVWALPGDKWGQPVEIREFYYARLPIAQNCLLVELDKRSVRTDNCSYKYPALCLSKSKHLLPLHCPPGYRAAKYGLNDSLCYGLEVQEEGASWEHFLKTRCSQPLQISSKIENYFIDELADIYDYDMANQCWIGLSKVDDKFLWYPNTTVTFVNWDSQTIFDNKSNVKGVVSKDNRWLLLDENVNLSCMACMVRADVKEAEISLQITSDSDIIQLIIYNPNSLWREDPDDPGVQCFSNAKGFERRVEIDEEPYRLVKLLFSDNFVDGPIHGVEKIVYELERLNEESGEYWCEGHTSKNFHLSKSSKLLITSKKLDRHIFVLKIRIFKICNDPSVCKPDWEFEAEQIKNLLNVRSAKFMKLENLDSNLSIDATVHISVKLIESSSCYEEHCNVIKTYFFLLEMCETTLGFGNYVLISLKSTEYCLPHDKSENSTLNWELTSIGKNVAPKEFCMQSNGLPVTRKCMGSFLEGGTWGPVVGDCSENYEPTNRTTFLYSLATGRTDSSTIHSFLTRDLISILHDKEDLIPADIYFLAMSLKTIMSISDHNCSLIDLGDTLNIAMAVDSFMDIDEGYLNLAQTMNSSNMLLESVDVILSKIAANKSDSDVYDTGIDLAITPHFLTQISSPHINNISGIALTRRPGSNSTLFTDLDVISLRSNMSIFDVLAIPNLEIATWITQDLLNNIRSLNRSINATSEGFVHPKIIIEAFYSDIVFQETKYEKDIVNSRIISVTVPGFESDLPLPLKMIYRRFDRNSSTERVCAYWDFGNRFSHGQWSKAGCFHIGSHEELDVCACLHLTHFAQLVLGFRGNGDNTGEVVVLYYHGRALNAITLVGCSLSLVGVAGIAATALMFPAWRHKAGSKVLLQLSAAIALQSIMMVSQDSFQEDDINCTILGAMLHYSVLAAFMWMLLTALLQFARYVKVLGVQRPIRFMVKFSLAGWGLPVLPVAILLIVKPSAYLPPPEDSLSASGAPSPLVRDPAALCYPQGLDLYLTVLLPVGCIVVTNLTVFVMVMRSILRGPDGKRRTADPELVISQLRLSVLLFFLLGLSWIFGLLAITGGEILFSYLFCLTATLQGFVLFVYFVVCDPATRVLWVSLVRERSRSSNKELSG